MNDETTTGDSGGTDEPGRPKRVVIRASAEPVPAAEAPPRPERDLGFRSEPSPSAPTSDGEPTAWGPALAAIGGAAAAFSILFPWWKVTYRGITLLDGSISGLSAWIGWVSLIAAWAILLTLAYDYSKPGLPVVPTIGLSAAAFLTVAGLASVLAPASVSGVSGVSTGMHVAPAIGAWLALAGGAASILGFGQMFARRR